jgi:S1-C subfamily serine protease
MLLGCGGAGYRQSYDEVSAFTPEDTEVITPLHYFESGRRALEVFLEDRPDLTQMLRQCKRACVRMQIRLATQGASYQEAQGSGVLIDGGRLVLTAGHGLVGTKNSEIRVTLQDGTRYAAKPVEWSFDRFGSANADWAVLEVQAPAGTSLPAMRIGRPETGRLAFVVGYPGHHGINEQGRLVAGKAYDGEFLAPLVSAGTVSDASPINLSPVAGAVPTGGMSGSPIISENGELIGIFVSTSSTPGRNGTTYSYQGAAISTLREKLRGSK